MRKIFFFMFVLISFSVSAQNITVSDTIKTNTTWSADTVFLDTSIVVIDNVTLTIDPGTVICTDSAYFLKIKGTLLAQGTENDPIIFTIKDTTGYYNSTHKGWQGIVFNNSEDTTMNDNDSSFIDYCNFSYTKNSNFYISAISVFYFSKLKITNSTFFNNTNTSGATCINIADSCEIIVTNNILKNNNGRNGIIQFCCAPNGSSHLISTSIINNNLITHNKNIWCSGIKISGYATPIIDGNTITYNECSGDAGGIMVSGYTSPLIQNNIVAYNKAKNGGGIFVKYETNPVLINNTIVFNSAVRDTAHNSGGNGGGITNGCSTDSILYINNIIYGNTAYKGNQLYINDDDCSKYKFYYNNIENGLDSIFFNDDSAVVYLNNIDVNPSFVDTTVFRLNCASLCKDAGKDTTSFIPSVDIFGVNRIEGTIDMGAVETQPAVPVDLGSDIMICQGSIETLDAGANYVAYVWNTSETTQTIDIDTAGSFSVVAFNAFHCETEDTLNVIFDTIPPTITCINDTIINLTSGQTEFTVSDNLFNAVGADNCSVNSTLNNYNSDTTLIGATFAIGDTTVTWTTTDASGNSIQCSFSITVNEFVNINTIKDINISTYPNPTSGTLFVAEAQGFDVSITDITGKNIKSIKNIPTNNFKIDLSNYPSGLYFLNFSSINNTVTEKVIIK